MKRFIVVGKDELDEYNDPHGYSEYGDEWDYPGYLVDVDSQEILWMDQMEPEDATLDRSLSPLVDLLNKVADGE